MRTTIDMAREVYGAHTEWNEAQLERLNALVALVRADERAGCCDAIWKCDGMGLEDRFIAMDVIKARGQA